MVSTGENKLKFLGILADIELGCQSNWKLGIIPRRKNMGESIVPRINFGGLHRRLITGQGFKLDPAREANSRPIGYLQRKDRAITYLEGRVGIDQQDYANSGPYKDGSLCRIKNLAVPTSLQSDLSDISWIIESFRTIFPLTDRIVQVNWNFIPPGKRDNNAILLGLEYPSPQDVGYKTTAPYELKVRAHFTDSGFNWTAKFSDWLPTTGKESIDQWQEVDLLSRWIGADPFMVVGEVEAIWGGRHKVSNLTVYWSTNPAGRQSDCRGEWTDYAEASGTGRHILLLDPSLQPSDSTAPWSSSS